MGYYKDLIPALEGNYSGVHSLYKKVCVFDTPVEPKPFIRVIDINLELKALWESLAPLYMYSLTPWQYCSDHDRILGVNSKIKSNLDATAKVCYSNEFSDM